MNDPRARRDDFCFAWGIVVGIMFGFGVGAMIEHRNTVSANSSVDECVQTARQCIGYLTECRGTAKP